MSIDVLQEKIRKLKNPVVLELGYNLMQIPGYINGCTGSRAEAFGIYCRDLLTGLKGSVGVVRVSFSAFAIMGEEGIAQLRHTLGFAAQQGYYVLLDAPEILSVSAAQHTAQVILGEDSPYPCDGLVVSGYLGTDILKAFLPYCKKGKKTLFVVCRTGNKSAAELQDLLAGSRLVHSVAADHVNRFGLGTEGKCGYSQVGILASAGSADSLRYLRGKYPGVFFLLDGFDYPNANAKSCSFAFDKYGHGAAVCVGTSITEAWQQAQSEGTDHLDHAGSALDRIRKNISRYVNIL